MHSIITEFLLISFIINLLLCQKDDKLFSFINGLKDVEEHMTSKQFMYCFQPHNESQQTSTLTDRTNKDIQDALRQFNASFEQLEKLNSTINNAINFSKNKLHMEESQKIHIGCYDNTNSKTLSVEPRKFCFANNEMPNSSGNNDNLLCSKVEFTVNSTFSLYLDLLMWYLHYIQIEIHSKQEQIKCQSTSDNWKLLNHSFNETKKDLSAALYNLIVAICKLMFIENSIVFNSEKTSSVNSKDLTNDLNKNKMWRKFPFSEMIRRIEEFDKDIENMYFPSGTGGHCDCERMLFTVNLKTQAYLRNVAFPLLANRQYLSKFSMTETKQLKLKQMT